MRLTKASDYSRSEKTLANCTQGRDPDLENNTKAYLDFASGSLPASQQTLKEISLVNKDEIGSKLLYY